MAIKPLKSIKFPGLPDTYTIEGLSSNAKAALLNCFEHVAWVDEHGQDYYDALEAALYQKSPYIYRITNRSLDKNIPCIDTGIALLSTDRTYSIFLDVTQNTAENVGTKTRIVECIDSSTSWKGIYFGNGSTASDAGYYIQWMNAESQASEALFKKSIINARFRVIWVHTKGTNTCDIYYKLNDETMNHEELTSTVLTHPSNVTLGDSYISFNFIGTYNEFIVYENALSSDEISTLMA